MSDLRDKLLSADWHMPDVDLLLSLARSLTSGRDPGLGASAYDRAFALAPTREDIRRERAAALDALAVIEHGITWRYIPAGPFVMGSEQGDDDESPPHAVELDAYYLSDTPITWVTYCARMGFSPPPGGMPGTSLDRARDFLVVAENKIRRGYCATGERFANATEAYAEKPMVAVSRASAMALGDKLETRDHRCRLPTEAEWEKGARGGWVGAEYAWGDAPPSPLTCDFDHFGDFSIRAPRSLPANSYGLYGMCGGVWEWVLDGYDAGFYATSPRRNPCCAEAGGDHVLRGGSWADCERAVRVAFRMGLQPPRRDYDAPWASPTIGFRLCRVAKGAT